MVLKLNPDTGNLDIIGDNGGGTVTSVSGTANRITISGTATDPIIDIAATYVGQATITTLGTVTTGTWNGSVVTEAYGGTNQSTYTTGDILYASGANTLSKLAVGSNTEVLTLAAGVPTWAAPAAGGDVVGPASAVSANLASFNGITGKLIQDSGIATGDVVEASSPLQQYRVIVGNSGAKDISALSSVGTSGQVLTSNGAGSNPSWQANPQGTVTSVSGTLNRITSTGGATPVIDIDSGYVGQASITTLGTITTGIWNGTAVSEVYGGTNQTTYTTGDILYASAVNTLSKLAAGSDGEVLTLASGVPSWATGASGFSWTDVTGTSDTMVAQNGYVANNVSLVTLTLPSSSTIGDTFKVITKGAGFCKIAQNASQTIQFAGSTTTTGVGGSLTATAVGDTLEIISTADDEFYVTSSIGSWTVV